jgi:hypothetical protein
MPRYHLHFHNGRELEEDEEGMDFPSSEAALDEAIRMARELWAGLPDARRDMAIEVVDEIGRTVLRIPFSAVTGSMH